MFVFVYVWMTIFFSPFFFFKFDIFFSSFSLFVFVLVLVFLFEKVCSPEFWESLNFIPVEFCNVGHGHWKSIEIDWKLVVVIAELLIISPLLASNRSYPGYCLSIYLWLPLTTTFTFISQGRKGKRTRKRKSHIARRIGVAEHFAEVVAVSVNGACQPSTSIVLRRFILSKI